MWEKMYNMKLGELLEKYPSSSQSERLLRVPGGWVYTYGDMEGVSSVLIPFNNEFQGVQRLDLCKNNKK
ncbi:MAG: hypothetical protein HQ522_16300 [Bacteroidetes bacterium]|nr:hypothetical protein [Bacteroidota bacterium]